ncbi:unnamed protein product [Spirodela intermedia]|uniref:Uncharacterized protein n=1 Tax=Spirodela intermedia TaxID=51605 RepID=A0A7I8J406_SPIIN|nr:unnamed protein product [Spirodela intermedia]CAA6664111.1 unnamed protein product [Spirodela intermedia]
MEYSGIDCGGARRRGVVGRGAAGAGEGDAGGAEGAGAADRAAAARGQGLQDRREGRFEALLASACNAQFENEVHYDANVTGTLSYGRIASVSGISAQELFLWFPVKGIHVDLPSSGIVYFDVGVVFKRFSLSLFQTPPECRANPPEAGGRRRLPSTGSIPLSSSPELVIMFA